MARIAQFVQDSRRKRVHPKKRRQHTGIVTTAIALLVIAFVLLLLVSISLPIVKAVYLFTLQAKDAEDLLPTSIGTEVRFGVWGYCATSILNPPTLLTNPGECTSPRLGYVVDDSVLSLVGEPQLLDIGLEALTFILVLHPICAVLCFISAVISFFSRIHGYAVLTLILTIITALVTSVSCAIDISIVAVAKNEVDAITEFQFEILWGNAPWMTLSATILLWLVVVLFSAIICGCCGVSRGLWIRYDIPEEMKEANQ